MSLSNPNADWEKPLPALYEELTSKERALVRRQYMRLQNWKCMFCDASLFSDCSRELVGLPIDWDLFPPNFLDYPVHLQHDHNTGLTEGAVHAYCNAFMWNYFRR